MRLSLVRLGGVVLQSNSFKINVKIISVEFKRKITTNVTFLLRLDAEPKYLVAVQPIPANEVKKQCKGMFRTHKKVYFQN